MPEVNVLTLNAHMGFNLFNRRFVLPELREAIRAVAADVVFLQEVMGENALHASRIAGWPAATQYEFLADSIWSQHAYGRNAAYPHGHHGNALLSKFPILQQQNRDVSVHGHEERGLLHCLLDVGGPAELPDRPHPLDLVAAVDEQLGIAPEGCRVAADIGYPANC